MPLSLIIAIVAYFLSAATGDKKNAARNAAIAGLGTYAYQSYNDLPTGFGAADRATAPSSDAVKRVVTDTDGNWVLDANGTPTYEYVTRAGAKAPAPVVPSGFLSSIGTWASNNAPTVLGAGALAAGASGLLSSPLLLGGLILLGAYMVLK